MTAVLSVGLAEGSSHVNWKKVRYTIVWWAVGFGVVMLCTSVLVAQGTFVLALYTVHSCVVEAVCCVIHNMQQGCLLVLSLL